MKHSHKQLRDEILGEAELADVSLEFWMQTDKSPLHTPYPELLAFQNGWAACKQHYGIPHDDETI